MAGQSKSQKDHHLAAPAAGRVCVRTALTSPQARQPLIFKSDRRPDANNDDDKSKIPADDSHFQQSLARLTAQLAARNPRAATGEPPLRRPPSSQSPAPQPPRARSAEPPVAPPRPKPKPDPQAVIREVVRRTPPAPQPAPTPEARREPIVARAPRPEPKLAPAVPPPAKPAPTPQPNGEAVARSPEPKPAPPPTPKSPRETVVARALEPRPAAAPKPAASSGTRADTRSRRCTRSRTTEAGTASAKRRREAVVARVPERGARRRRRHRLRQRLSDTRSRCCARSRTAKPAPPPPAPAPVREAVVARVPEPPKPVPTPPAPAPIREAVVARVPEPPKPAPPPPAPAPVREAVVAHAFPNRRSPCRLHQRPRRYARPSLHAFPKPPKPAPVREVVVARCARVEAGTAASCAAPRRAASGSAAPAAAAIREAAIARVPEPRLGAAKAPAAAALRAAEANPPPQLGPATAAPAATRPRVGMGYAVAWALGIGVGAIAAGAFVGFLVNGPPRRRCPAIADVAPPTPAPPITPEEITRAGGAAPASTKTDTANAAAPPTPARDALPPLRPPQAATSQPSPSEPLATADVRDVQARLRALGFNPGPVDGAAGPQTTAAVKQYQQARGSRSPARSTRIFWPACARSRRRSTRRRPPPPPRRTYAASPPPRRRGASRIRCSTASSGCPALRVICAACRAARDGPAAPAPSPARKPQPLVVAALGVGLEQREVVAQHLLLRLEVGLGQRLAGRRVRQRSSTALCRSSSASRSGSLASAAAWLSFMPAAE